MHGKYKKIIPFVINLEFFPIQITPKGVLIYTYLQQRGLGHYCNQRLALYCSFKRKVNCLPISRQLRENMDNEMRFEKSWMLK